MTEEKTLVCLYGEWLINGKIFRYLQGSLPAKTILKLADVPAFGKKDNHQDVAQNIPPYKDPVIKWQRPEMPDKIKDIAELYANKAPGVMNPMPNPIILCDNTDTRDLAGYKIDVKAFKHTVGDVEKTVEEIRNVKILYPDNKPKGKPLWILDGQHRTKGMNETKNWKDSEGKKGLDRSSEKIPFILLYGDEYKPGLLAKIFTHVTSKASAMSAVHKAWMHYSFGIEPYHTVSKQQSMECVTYLTVKDKFPDKDDPSGDISNIFRDKIQYNPIDEEFSGVDAYYFDCESLANVISKEYYSIKNPGKLTTEDLAKQINAAVSAFRKIDAWGKNKQDGSILHGTESSKSSTGGRRLATAFVCGVLRYLKSDNKTGFDGVQSWSNHLSDNVRRFHAADWRLDWIGDMSGADGNKSFDIAKEIFHIYLKSDEDNQPGGKENPIKIINYLRGFGGKFKVERVQWNYKSNSPKINASNPATGATFSAQANGVESFSMNKRPAFVIYCTTPNVYIDRVVDAEVALSQPIPIGKHNKKAAIKYMCKDELERETPGVKNKCSFFVVLKSYGGQQFNMTLEFESE